MARILITGASRGIGRGTAVALAGRGHEVIATARDVAALDDVPAALRLSLDVTDQASVDAAIARAGRVDVLVSNAGATVRAPLETVPLEAVEQLIELNTLGALRVAQAVLPGMRAQGSGQLIFVSSIQGRLVLPLIGAYAASKWALEALAETLAVEAGSLRHLRARAAARGGGVRRRRTGAGLPGRRQPLPAAAGQDRGLPRRADHRRGSRGRGGRDGGPGSQGGLQDPGRRIGQERPGRPQGRAGGRAVPEPPRWTGNNPQASSDGSGRFGHLPRMAPRRRQLPGSAPGAWTPGRPDPTAVPARAPAASGARPRTAPSAARSAARPRATRSGPPVSTPATAGTPLDCASTTAAEAMLGPAPTAPTRAAVLKLSTRPGSRALLVRHVGASDDDRGRRRSAPPGPRRFATRAPGRRAGRTRPW